MTAHRAGGDARRADAEANRTRPGLRGEAAGDAAQRGVAEAGAAPETALTLAQYLKALDLSRRA